MAADPAYARDAFGLAVGHREDDGRTSICEVWPTPRAGFWHVRLRGPQSHATKEPLPSDVVPELLEATSAGSLSVKPLCSSVCAARAVRNIRDEIG
jgi:hypothetical protein